MTYYIVFVFSRNTFLPFLEITSKFPSKWWCHHLRKVVLQLCTPLGSPRIPTLGATALFVFFFQFKMVSQIATSKQTSRLESETSIPIWKTVSATFESSFRLRIAVWSWFLMRTSHLSTSRFLKPEKHPGHSWFLMQTSHRASCTLIRVALGCKHCTLTHVDFCSQECILTQVNFGCKRCTQTRLTLQWSIYDANIAPLA